MLSVPRDVDDNSATRSPSLSFSASAMDRAPIRLEQKLSRSNVFASLWLTARIVRVIGEIGRVSGGDIATYNQFADPQAADPRSYISVGVSFGW